MMWLEVVQLLGSDRYAASGYPELHTRLAAIATVQPKFAPTYSAAAAFLSGDPKRTAALERILAVGEAALPDDFELPMGRGMAAYFGAYDLEAASAHFRRASELPSAPSYLAAFAERLTRTAHSCRKMQSDFVELTSKRDMPSARVRLEALLTQCVKRDLERAAAAARLKEGGSPSITQLIENGYCSPPPTLPGRCWVLEGGIARLDPCPTK